MSKKQKNDPNEQPLRVLEPWYDTRAMTHREDGLYLPRLIGTASQIVWARAIRHQYLTTLFDQLTDNRLLPQDPAHRASLYQVAHAVRNEPSAKRWIDRREDRKNPIVPLKLLSVTSRGECFSCTRCSAAARRRVPRPPPPRP
jgi:hypothetical protein